MTQVVSFEDYVPPARFDTIPWTHVQIEEAATSTGTWALIDTLALSPVDSDPSSPASRSFTTDNGTGPELWYRVIFTDANSDTSNPTEAVQNTEPVGTTYITAAQMKSTLEISGETYADDDIATALEAASRVIDAYKGTRFFPSTETRKYTPSDLGYCDSLPIYDLNNSVTPVVTVDVDGDGVYETTWTRNTDFYLEPQDADLTGKPWDQITLRHQSGRQWPRTQYGVKVAGSFGWATAPAQVIEACSILANRYLKRTRETPYGIVTVGTDALSMARLGKIDPDVAFMLDNVTDEDVPTLIL